MELQDQGLTVRRAFDGVAVLEAWDLGSPPSSLSTFEYVTAQKLGKGIWIY